MLAVLEAMVGLFYNIIVIARFVGLYGIKAQEQQTLAASEPVSRD